MDTDKNPIEVSVPVPGESSRLLALMTLLFLIPKFVILIPHFVALWVLGIAAFVVGVFAQVVVLFSGKYPHDAHKFMVGVMRWQVRVNSYLFGLRDEYPPFTLKK